MNPIVLNCKSYYDHGYSLRLMPIPVYVHDPRFHLHGLAIRHPDGTCTFETDVSTAIERLRAAYGQELEQVTVVVHHGHFDLYVLATRFGLKPRFIIDTLNLVHAIDGRRGSGGAEATVTAIADRLGLPAKSDIDALCGVRNLDGRQRIALAEHARQDVTLTAAIAEHYLPILSRPAVELHIARHTLLLHHERGFHVDVTGISVLMAKIQADTQRWFQQAGVTASQARDRSDFQTLLGTALGRTGRKMPMKMASEGWIPATSKQDEAMQALVGDDDPVVAALAQARLAQGSQVQSQARLETLRSIATATGGILPVHLVYHGASTGRFAGGGRFNLQNLPKRGLASGIRNLIGAAPGHVLALVDLAQIECRVTAWLGSDPRMLDAFRQQVDIYAQEATAIFREPVRKPTTDDAPEFAVRLTAMRQVGKQEVLGLGYGMGALRFLNTLRSDPVTAALFEQGVLHPRDCVRIVDAFRATFYGITRLWDAAENAFRQLLVTKQPQRIGPCQVVWSEPERTALVQLPSSRMLRYPDLRLEASSSTGRCLDRQGRDATWTRSGDHVVFGDDIALYGGKIVENLAQAIARDLLVEAILRVEGQGVTVLAHIHDEIIATAPETDGQRVLDLVLTELKRPPTWAPDLPLEAEGRLGKTLGK